MRTFFTLLTLLIPWIAASTALSRDIFVNNVAGDDHFSAEQAQDPLGLAGPVRTLAKALQMAKGSDVVILANTGVPYRESISLVGSRHGGTAEQPFVIRGGGAVLDGSETMPADAWRHYQNGVFRFCPPRLGFQQLFLDGRPAVRVAVAVGAKEPPDLKPREWCSFGGQIYFCVEPTKLPSDYNPSYAGRQTGITLFHVEHVIIADLTVRGFQVDGINLFNSVQDVTLANVKCRENGRSGITVGGASMAKIGDSLAAENGLAQLLTLPYSETHVIHTQLVSNTAPGLVERGGLAYIDGVRVDGKQDETRPGARP